MSGLISSLAWVPQGRAVRHPAKYELDEAELARVSALARVELEDAKSALAGAGGEGILMGEDGEVVEDEGWESDEDEEENGEDEDGDASMAVDEPTPAAAATAKPSDPDDLSAYNLDDYDEETKGAAGGVFSNIKGLTYYRNANDDPFITMPENDDDLDREELEVLPTDNMLITAKTEDELSQLEVHVYDESNEALYVHHDLMLPAFPLCLEWLDFPPAGSSSPADQNAAPSSSNPAKTHGNYIAVGTFDPEIEIWSLDTIDGLYPDALLGRPDKTSAHVPVPMGTGKKKSKLVKPREVNADHHVDAVLGLSWNTQHRSLLASASADKTVKLWDLSRGGEEGSKAVRSFGLHEDKVQAVEWCKASGQGSVLLTGSYDRTVRTWDSRSPAAGVGAYVGADVEGVRWDPFDPYGFYVSLESGLVLSFDSRTLPSSPTLLQNTLKNPLSSRPTTPAKFTLAAHEGAACALDVSPHVRGCIVTGGTDKMVKVWNINEEEGQKREVSLVTSRDLGVGKVFSLSFSPDSPLTVAAAGSKAKLQVWDLSTNGGARKAFGPRLRQAGRELREAREEGKGLIGVESDGEDSEEEMEE